MLKKLISPTEPSAPSDKATPVVAAGSTDEPPASSLEPKANELERLREILYGSQARNTEKRLGDLEIRLEDTHRSLSDALNEKLQAVSDTASARLSDARQELGTRLDEQSASQSAQLRAVQKDLTERLDRQAAEQAAQLRAVQKELRDALEQLAADMLHQLRASHKELSDRIDKLSADTAERMRSLQSETRQRDDSLRQELLTLASSLDDKKASRQDLGQMLMELGLRLGSDSKPPSS
jgi:hypothetical protein